MRFSRYLFLRLNPVALGRHARRRFVATGACDISNMVYKLIHGYIPIMFIGQNEKSLELAKNCMYRTI